MQRPKVAFVGSGGATKGLAHIGAWRAIEELGIDVDIFVGTSAGAIASACFSQGLSSDEVVDWFRVPWKRRGKDFALRGRHFLGLPTLRQAVDPGWLTSGLFSIDPLERFLARRLPVNDFRDVDRTVLVTAADVDGRGRVVFGKGHREDVSISQAVAASSSVPLLYRPYRIGGRYYMDGEVVRTLSIDLAIAAGADVVIVSNVYRPHVTRPGRPSLAHSGPLAMGRQALNVILSQKEERGIELIHQLHPRVTILNVSADLGRFSFTSRRNARRLLMRGYRESLRVLATAKRRRVFDYRPNVHTIGEA